MPKPVPTSHPPSRRGFVKAALGAAAAFAAPAIIPSSALGNARRAAAGERVALGFIGVGTMNLRHLIALLGRRDTQVVAVCEVDATRRENAKRVVEAKYAELERQGFSGCAAYVDHHDLLARDDIDAVVIGTPDHWHAIGAIDACRAKKDVYCEKPLTLTICEGPLMIEAVRRHGRVFQTGSQQRSEREFRTACEYVRSGRIGRVQTVWVDAGRPSRPCDLPEEPMEPGLDWDRWLGPAPLRPYNSILSPRGVHTHFPHWRHYREYAGGSMTDRGAHHFDIAQWALGMDEGGPVEVHPPEDPRADKGVRFVYANGTEVIHGGDGGLTFVGTEGKIIVNRGLLRSEPEGLLREPLTDKDVRLPVSPGHYDDWLRCVRTREKPIADVEVGARSATVCHLGNLAYWNRRKLKWAPARWEFPGDAEANGWRDRERREPYGLPEV